MINFVTALKWALLVTMLMSQVNAGVTQVIKKEDTTREPKKIVCYYTSWGAYRSGTAKFTTENIDLNLCTHLIYAYSSPDIENGIKPYDKNLDLDQAGYVKFNDLKSRNKNLKTLLAIRSGSDGSFSKIAADKDRRASFVKNVIQYLRQYNFDGFDLVWKYPAFGDGSQPEDRENYSLLVKELREEFEKESIKTGKSRLLLTMIVPGRIEYIDKGYDVQELNRHLDFFNLFSYDYYPSNLPNTYHVAPLYSPQEGSKYNIDANETIDNTIKYYLKKGADPQKLILGIGTFGRSYTLSDPKSTDLGSPTAGPGQPGDIIKEKGNLAYVEICENIKNGGWKVIQSEKGSSGPYAFHENQWVSYDDPDMVKVKAKYANEKGLGGLLFWSLENDDFGGVCHGKPNPLISAGKEALLSSNSGSSDITFSTKKRGKKTK